MDSTKKTATGKFPVVDLEDYKKENPEKMDAVATSLHLERHQLQFVRENNLNLSRLVRDFLENLISQIGGKK